MFSELAVFIAGVVVFIVGFGLAYRQGKKRGYEDGYSVGICNGYGQGYTTASENLLYYPDNRGIEIFTESLDTTTS